MMGRSLEVSPENRGALYVAIPVYFVVLGVVAFFSYRRARSLEKKQANDQLVGHYLGGRDFGPILTAGTVFASCFSGYTVVGVPNESFTRGFYGFRWVPSFCYIIFGFMATGVRLRKVSLVRNHHTPVDFITDLWRSQLLRYTIFSIQILAAFIYLAAQVNALQSTFNGMFGFDPSDVWPVIVIMLIILAFEWAGGLVVVAMSDSIQGFVMLITFFTLPFVIMKNYGGWKDIDPSTYGRPDFYQTPSSDDQWEFWQFSLINICFFSLPHLIQRIYAARDLTSLKAGFVAQTLGPWITQYVGVFIGTMGVVMGVAPDTDSPFTAIIEEVMSLGGFAKGVGVIALTASLAAIMSTADSLIIAISQLVTVEVVWPYNPSASHERLAWIGRFVSLFSVIISLLIGIFWKGGVSAMTAINFPIMIQAVPTFLIGLYRANKLHPWSLAFGAISGTVFVIGFFFGYIYLNPNAKPINAGIIGVILNVIFSYSNDYLWFGKQVQSGDDDDVSKERYRPSWDIPQFARFGEGPLTFELINKMMGSFPEPMRSVAFNMFFFLSVSVITPLVAEGQPVINADTGEFVSDPPIVRGIPWWFLKQTLLTVVPYVVLLKLIYDVPNEYEYDEEKIDREGIDVEVLELTPNELNFRVSFDSRNESVLRRRSAISTKMEALGLSTSVTKKSLRDLPESSRLSFVIRKEKEASNVVGPNDQLEDSNEDDVLLEEDTKVE